MDITDRKIRLGGKLINNCTDRTIQASTGHLIQNGTYSFTNRRITFDIDNTVSVVLNRGFKIPGTNLFTDSDQRTGIDRSLVIQTASGKVHRTFVIDGALVIDIS